MRLTPRWRILLLLTLACFVGWVTISWGWVASIKLVDHYRGGGYCVGDWRDLGNLGCGSGIGGRYSPLLGWIGILGCIVLLAVLGWAMTLWVLHPFRTMAQTVDRLGPTSLGVRLRAVGPQDESRRLSDAIDALLDRVAEGYEAQRRFAANASHELRTPLATQRALIEVSLTAPLTDDQRELLARQLLSTNERNEHLVEGLLSLAETERGLMTHAPVRLDLAAEEAVALLHRAAADAEIVVEARTTTPVTVAGEQPLVERLVANLVHNAIKYNEPGGWVRVETHEPGTLVVANSGPVLAPQDVPGLFEPFRRRSGERLEHGGGVGLGLTIVRSIVAAHTGSVLVEANREGGLIVTVRLPPVR